MSSRRCSRPPTLPVGVSSCQRSLEAPGAARMAINIDDLRRLAMRRLPRAVFDFADGGAEDEQTLRANRADFAKLTLRPKILVDVSKRDQATTILGQPVSSPLIL